MIVKKQQSLPDEILPDAVVRQYEDNVIVIRDSSAARDVSDGGEIRLGWPQAQAFRRVVRGESLFDGDRDDPHVVAVDLDTVWVLPHEQVAEQVQFVRANLDEFYFEKEDKSAACQLTADQAQALYEFLSDIEASAANTTRI